MNARIALHRSLVKTREAHRARLARRDRQRGFPELRASFERRLGYAPDLESPQTFHEKVQWRKLYDRNPLFPLVADKLRARDYVCERLGAATGEKILKPLLHVTDTPETLPLDRLPKMSVIKPNHAAGRNIFLRDTPAADRTRIIRTCHAWLLSCYNSIRHEWVYSEIPPRILVEQDVSDPDPEQWREYRFHMFGGRLGVLQVDQTGCADGSLELSKRPVNGLGYDVLHNLVPGFELVADDVEEMLDIARPLSAPFDYVRVDLMRVRNRTYFGEMTLYPSGGIRPILPGDAGHILGAMWTLDRSHVVTS